MDEQIFRGGDGGMLADEPGLSWSLEAGRRDPTYLRYIRADMPHTSVL